MSLGELIEILEAQDGDLVLTPGFADPHSYRGDYSELAMEPRSSVSVRDLLADLRASLGKTFEGYKGGDYKMSEWSRVWVAEYGSTSDDCLGPFFLKVLIDKAKSPETFRVSEVENE